MEVTIREFGNMLEIKPANSLLYLLDKQLSFVRIVPRHKNKPGSKREVDAIPVMLYRIDEAQDVIYTYAGLLTRVVKVLEDSHFVVKVLDCDTGKPKFEPQWDRIVGVKLREAQEQMLACIVSSKRAQLNGVTAIGKSFLIKTCCKLYPQEGCFIVVAAPQQAVVRALHRDLVEMFPGEVGLCGCGHSDPCRITVTTAASLDKCRPERVSVLFFDEVHGAGAQGVGESLQAFSRARMYGFSASTECRTDRADRMVEALFGPVRVKVSYQEAMAQGVVPKIDTHFYQVHVPESTKVNRIAKKRDTVWNNESWNAAVVLAAKHWEKVMPDGQILVLTNTVEHMFRLRQLLTDYVPFYADLSKEKLEILRYRMLVEPSFTPMKASQRNKLQQQIECGGVRRIISTTALGTGVDMRHLDVFIRADGGSSEVTNIQFRGRVTRGESGVYVDFMVYGDLDGQRRSKARYASCKRAGWGPVEEPIPL
jgi:superfamily II DNA or RNA helicase